MPTTLQHLARWATALDLAEAPPRVTALVRLQHLGAAGIVRSLASLERSTTVFASASSRGAGVVVGGRKATRRDALRLHLSLAGTLGWSDSALLGQPLLGSVVGAWSGARGHTVDEVLRATVAGNEVAARVGASLLLGPRAGVDGTLPLAAGVATAAGVLAGLDADGLARALALALAASPAPSRRVSLAGAGARAHVWGAAGTAGLDAVELASRGAGAPLDLLDDRAGPLAAACWLPLRHAFTGLGEAWFTETLAFRLDPVHLCAQVPVQAAHEILRRHVKAADKRLRADQVAAVEVHTGLPGWMLEQHMDALPGLSPDRVFGSIRRSIGLAVAAHSLHPSSLEGADAARTLERMSLVADRVTVHHDYERTAALVDHAVSVATPLLSGLTPPELRAAGRAAQAWHGHRPKAPGPLDLVALLRLRPVQLLDRIRYAPHDLGQARLSEWQDRFDCEVRLHTTRGGTWPERRTVAEGSPGWPEEATATAVQERFANGDEGLAAAAAQLLATPSTDPAEGWVRALLA